MIESQNLYPWNFYPLISYIPTLGQVQHWDVGIRGYDCPGPWTSHSEDVWGSDRHPGSCCAHHVKSCSIPRAEALERGPPSFVVPTFTHSLDKHLCSTCYMPGWGTAENKTKWVCPRGLLFWMETDNCKELYTAGWVSRIWGARSSECCWFFCLLPPWAPLYCTISGWVTRIMSYPSPSSSPCHSTFTSVSAGHPLPCQVQTHWPTQAREMYKLKFGVIYGFPNSKDREFPIYIK